MTTKISLNDSIKVEVVPQYFYIRRKHGQLLKDFGLLQHQRKAVYDLVNKFMHANSHQNYLREKAPSDIRTHKSGLGKSQSLGCLNTIEQSDLTNPLPLSSTDSESDDDTPPKPSHDVIQSHANGDVIVNIQTPYGPSIQDLEYKLEGHENHLHFHDIEKPDVKKYYDRNGISNRHRRVYGPSALDEDERRRYYNELREHGEQRAKIVADIVETKNSLGVVRKKEKKPAKNIEHENEVLSIHEEIPAKKPKPLPVITPSEHIPTPVQEEKAHRWACVKPKPVGDRVNPCVLTDKMIFETFILVCNYDKFGPEVMQKMEKYTTLDKFLDKERPQMFYSWNKIIQKVNQTESSTGRTYAHMIETKELEDRIFKLFGKSE